MLAKIERKRGRESEKENERERRKLRWHHRWDQGSFVWQETKSHFIPRMQCTPRKRKRKHKRKEKFPEMQPLIVLSLFCLNIFGSLKKKEGIFHRFILLKWFPAIGSFSSKGCKVDRILLGEKCRRELCNTIELAPICHRYKSPLMSPPGTEDLASIGRSLTVSLSLSSGHSKLESLYNNKQ